MLVFMPTSGGGTPPGLRPDGIIASHPSPARRERRRAEMRAV
jgi:hypothetical protein